LTVLPATATVGAPERSVSGAFTVRTFTRFAYLHGLVEMRKAPEGDRTLDYQVRKTPVLDDFVRFSV
jgi:hypothetical protein